ncbi:MAG TPA: divalent-cation tolerance protein CutA [Dokdonella sp.]
MSVLLALCTTPNDEVAARLARILVEERLAACVNRIGGVRSTYRWEGEIRDEAEVLLLIKTTRERFAALESRLSGLHPYEVPELIAFEAVAGLAAYLGWVATETGAQ